MRTMTFGLPTAWLWVAAIGLTVGMSATAQKTQNEPATDSAAQSSPIQPTPRAPVTDSAAQASPIRSNASLTVWIAPHTEIDLRLGRSLDSGRLKNGEAVQATLAKAVALSPKGMLEAGTPAELTVIETLAAGRIYAAGEFSLQLQRLGSVSVYTDTLTYRGQPGHKDLADSAPAVGTDAGLAAGAELVFHVLPPPQPANGPPKAGNASPGSVGGVTTGGRSLAGSSTQTNSSVARKSGFGKTNSAQAKPMSPASNTPEPAENLGKSSPAPNQPAPPNGTNSTQTTQPHP